MDRIFLTKAFYRWMSKNSIRDMSITLAVEEMENGLVDAELGGSLCKKRISIPGRGKRGGAKTIVATKHQGRWFFLYGFNKNERSNINSKELRALQELGDKFLNISENELSSLIGVGAVKEVLRNESYS